MTTVRQGIVVDTDSEIRAVALKQVVKHLSASGLNYTEEAVVDVAKRFEAYLKHG